MNISNEEILKDNIQIGKFIRANRIYKNILAKDLADILDVSPVAISHWERGEKLPTIERVAMLSHLFGITLDDFYSCTYPMEMMESRTRLYDYVLKKDKLIFDKLNCKNQKEIIKEYILSLKQFYRYISDFLRDKEIDETKFDELSSLLGVFFVNINEVISPYYVIYKINNDFDVQDYFTLKTKNQFLNYIDSSHFVISCPNGKTDVLFLTMLKEKDKRFISNYEESLLETYREDVSNLKAKIYDSNGNAALAKDYNFFGKLTSRMLKEFKLICKIRKIDTSILLDNIEFGYLNDFTQYLLKKENIEFLKEILFEISKEYKDGYLNIVMQKNEKEVKILYELLMAGATFDDSNKTIALFKKVCEALYKNESYIK